jgi:chromosome segregation ATPase
MDYSSIVQDLKLRLDMIQDEKEEVEKQLKVANIRATKADDLQMKNDNLNDMFKQLKSRHLLLIEKVKKHADSCHSGQSLHKVLTKLNQLSQIP